MDSDALLQLARSMPRDRFASWLPSLFLVIEVRASEPVSEFEFETAVLDTQGRAAPAEDLEIIELKKAPGNPYPDRISVGRARNCDVVLRDRSISKLHAHFRVSGRGKQGEVLSYDVVDLGSQNGTRLGDKNLVEHQPEAVRIGDLIHFGKVSTKLVGPGELWDRVRQPKP